jgi:hypothetical protein
VLKLDEFIENHLKNEEMVKEFKDILAKRANQTLKKKEYEKKQEEE